MSKWPRVSVVISNYNGIDLKLLPDCLESILKNNYPNLEVILVDNASTDKSISYVSKNFGKNKRLKVIRNRVNMYSQGLNLGIENATGEYVAFFNNDAYVKNDYFQKFINKLENNRKVALAQGLLVSYYDHQKIDSAGETMDPYGNPITIGAGESIKKAEYQKSIEVLSVSGSCSLLRKSAVLEIGKFDPDYGIGYEDLDLSLRAWLRGQQVMYYPEIISYHKRGATDLSPVVRLKARWHFNKNRIATILKNFPASFIIKNLPITLLIYLAAGIWEIFVKHKVKLGMTRFSSLYWVLLNLPQIFEKRKKVLLNQDKKSFYKINKLLFNKGLAQSIGSYLKA